MVSSQLFDADVAQPWIIQNFARSDLKIDFHHKEFNLLKKDLHQVFFGNAKPQIHGKGHREIGTIITLAFKTENDMSGWDDAACHEREAKQLEFIEIAKTLCTYFQLGGAWADFVDPRDGQSYLQKESYNPRKVERSGISPTHQGYAQLNNICI